jgi:membrane-associated phospholipid phosphatase
MKKNILILFCLIFFQGFSQNGDINLLKKINGSYTESGGKVLTVVTNSINPVALGLPIGMFAVGVIAKDKETRLGSYELTTATILCSILTTTTKFAVDRDRPFVTYPNDVVKYTKAGSHSFPSGHTSMAFTTATSISLLYPKWYVIAPSFLWASAIGYSRMYLGVHYPTDVFAGAIIGAGTSLGTHYLFRYIKRKKEAKQPDKL